MNGRDMNEAKIFDSIDAQVANLPTYIRNWYLNIRASGCTASTCRDFVSKLVHFLCFINENPASVTLRDINEITVTEYFLSIKEKKDSSGNIVRTSDSYQGTVWSCLNNFMNYMVKRGDLQRNYMEFIKRPKNNDLDRINDSRILLSAEDFQAIKNAAEKESNGIRRARDIAVLSLFMNTGMRKTALSNIMLSDVDLLKKELRIIDKGDKYHTYYLSDVLCDQISDWLSVRKAYNKNKEDYLFLSQKGGKLSSRTITDIVGKYSAEALKHKISPHKLRSGYCSILYKKTHDIEFVRRAVGHSSSRVTQRYIVTKGDERKRAADIISDIFS